MDKLEEIIRRQQRLEKEYLVYRRMNYELEHGIATFDELIKIYERSNQYGRNTSSSRNR